MKELIAPLGQPNSVIDTIPSNFNGFSSGKNLNYRIKKATRDHLEIVFHKGMEKAQTFEIKFSETIIPTKSLELLSNYPNLCEAYIAIISLNLDTSRNSDHNVLNATKSMTNSCIAFFGFIIDSGKYHLEYVTEIDISKFHDSLYSYGQIAQTTIEKLKTLSNGIIKGEENAISLLYDTLLRSPLERSGVYRFNNTAFKNKYGYPAINHIPDFLAYAIDKRLMEDNKQFHFPGVITEDSFNGVGRPLFRTIIFLHKQTSDDRLSFKPYTNEFDAVKSIRNITPQKTQNIDLETATKLFTTSIDWIENKADAIIELGNKIRNIQEMWIKQHGYSRESYKRRAMFNGEKNKWDGLDLFNSQLQLAWLNIAKKHKIQEFKITYLNNKNKNKNKILEVSNHTLSFEEALKILITSCAIQVGVNTARRRNEYIGENKSWGLYLGCLSKKNGMLQQSYIDIYVEKTFQDYSLFPCNKITERCVVILEALYQLSRPLFTDHVTPPKDITEARKLKLFKLPIFTINNIKRVITFSFTSHTKSFYKQAGVDNNTLNGKTHIFRRFFAVLYFYRFSESNLRALSRWLGHLNYQMTMVYITDNKNRSTADQIERLHKASELENQDILNELKAAQFKFTRSIIDKLFDGEVAGGYMQKILRLHRIALTSSVATRISSKTYNKLDSEDQKELLTESMVQNNSMPTPDMHGNCHATEKKRGACYNNSDKKNHKELASAKMCSKCPFNSFSIENVNGLEEEEQMFLLESKNYSMPKSYRHHAAEQANTVRKIIQLEKTMLNKLRKSVHG